MANYNFMNYGRPTDPVSSAAYSAVNPGLSNGGLGYTQPIDYTNSLRSFGAQTPIGGVDQSAVSNAVSTLGTGTDSGQPNWLSSLFGGALTKSDGLGGTNQGWLTPAIAGAGALASGFLGLKQYGLAKDQFNFQKQAYQTGLENQSKLTNARLADRQAQRVANNPNSTSVADYLKKYGV